PLGVAEGTRPRILGTIAGGELSLVINTPMPVPGAFQDAAAVRHAALAEGILCLTNMDTAVAAARSLDPSAQSRVVEIRALGDWLAAGRGSATGSAGV
ncbi:MAG: hypothetical protein ACC726_15600, partial [Chloroflexota bacterium]